MLLSLIVAPSVLAVLSLVVIQNWSEMRGSKSDL